MKTIKLYNRDNFDVYFVEDFNFTNNIFEGYLIGNFISIGIDYNDDGSKILSIDPNGGPQILINKFIYTYSDELGTKFELIEIIFDEENNRFKLIFDYLGGEIPVEKEYIIIEQSDENLSTENDEGLIK